MNASNAMNKKRPRVEDSDDDDEMWSEAVLFEEAIIRTQASQQAPAGGRLSIVDYPSTSKVSTTATTTDLQRKVDNLLAELTKKAREKLDLMNELNRLRATNVDFCEKNCKKQLSAANTDLRFKENELSNLRKRVKELTTKLESNKEQAPVAKFDSGASSEAAPQRKKKSRSYPSIRYTPHPDLQVMEDFVDSDSMDKFAHKQFVRWSSFRGDTDITAEYLDRLTRCLPAVYLKALETKDPTVWAALLDFLASIQNHSGAEFFEIIDWREFLCATDHHQDLLQSLIRFLRTSPNSILIYPKIRSFILEEQNWRSETFEQFLSSAMDFVFKQPLSYEGEYVAKEILRVYRQILHTHSDPDVMKTLMTSSLKFMFQGADLDAELVSVVTRAEAFHHLGSVLKTVIRWQPTVSHTGCPEMMEIAEMSFRDT